MSRSYKLSDRAFAVIACLAIVLGFAARLAHELPGDTPPAPVARALETPPDVDPVAIGPLRRTHAGALDY